MLMQDGWDLMDSQGRPITLDEMTPAQFMELYADSKNRPLLNAMVHPAVLELTGDDRVDTRYVTNLRLSDLVTGNAIEDVLFGQSAKSKAVAASYVDAIAGNESLTRYVHEVLIAQTTAAKSFTKGLGAEIARAAGTTEEVVDLLRMLAPYNGVIVPHPNADGTVTEMPAFESLKLLFREERRKRQLKQRFGFSGQEGEVAEQLLFSILQEAKESLLDQMDPNPTEADLREHERRLDLLDSLMNSGTMDATVATYSRYSTPADRYQLHSYVFENRGILQSAPTNRALRDLLEAGWTDNESGLPELSDSDWESIAKAVVSYELDRQYGIAVPGAPIVTIPGKEGNWDLKYWDPDFNYLLDDLLDLAPAMAELQETFQRSNARYSLTQIAQRMAETVLNPKRYGVPTEAMKAQMLQGFSQMFASSSKQGIGRGGLGPQAETTEGMATRRTYVVPDDSLRTTAVFTADDLANWANTNGMRVRRPGSGELSLEPMWLLRGRFTNEITAPDGTVVARVRKQVHARRRTGR